MNELVEKYLCEQGGMPPQYKSLNDAVYMDMGLAKGSTEIWYMSADSFRFMSSGPSFMKDLAGKPGVPELPTSKTVKNTHVLLGKIAETDLNKIFRIMQGDYWSPVGQARSLIRSKKLRHTSMSVGDIIKVKGKFYMVDMSGFEKLK